MFKYNQRLRSNSFQQPFYHTTLNYYTTLKSDKTRRKGNKSSGYLTRPDLFCQDKIDQFFGLKQSLPPQSSKLSLTLKFTAFA